MYLEGGEINAVNESLIKKTNHLNVKAKFFHVKHFLTSNKLEIGCLSIFEIFAWVSECQRRIFP